MNNFNANVATINDAIRNYYNGYYNNLVVFYNFEDFISISMTIGEFHYYNFNEEEAYDKFERNIEYISSIHEISSDKVALLIKGIIQLLHKKSFIQAYLISGGAITVSELLVLYRKYMPVYGKNEEVTNIYEAIKSCDNDLLESALVAVKIYLAHNTEEVVVPLTYDEEDLIATVGKLLEVPESSLRVFWEKEGGYTPKEEEFIRFVFFVYIASTMDFFNVEEYEFTEESTSFAQTA